MKGKTEAEKKAAKKESSDDDWGLDDDWGEPAVKSSQKKTEPQEKAGAPLNAKAEIEKKKEEEKKRRDMFDNKELEDLPVLGEGKDEKIKDEFNQVLSTSKENGGFLASMGLKKGEVNDESLNDDSQEEDPHKKSDLFDTSKAKIAKGGKVQTGIESDEDEFDDLRLGEFGSNKKGKDKGKKGSDNEGEMADMGYPDLEDMTAE